MNAEILIRCDGGPRVGMGHVVRCLSLASALRAQGVTVAFATWADHDSVARKIRAHGYPWLAVGEEPAARAPLSAGDLAATLRLAQQQGAGTVLVDHYQAGADFLQGLKSAGLRVAVIDDQATRDLRAADWILNQNPAAGRLAYRVREDCVVLRGLQYALLRHQFAAQRGKVARRFTPEDHRVLLTLGGGAMAARSAAILLALGRIRRRLEVRCVLGSAEGAGAIQRAAEQVAHLVTLRTDVSDMAEEMSLSDVSVNGGGSTCWELCCLGLPMVCVSLSDDQADNVEWLGVSGLAVTVGTWQDCESSNRIAGAVEALLGAVEQRKSMSSRMLEQVDGLGAQRVAENLCALVRRRVEATR